MIWMFTGLFLLLAWFSARMAWEELGAKPAWVTRFYTIYSVACIAAAGVVLFVS